MHKASAVFAFLVLAVTVWLFWLFFNARSGAEQRIESLQMARLASIDSMKLIVIQSDSMGYFGYKDCQEGKNKMEGDRNYWRNKARKCELGQ